MHYDNTYMMRPLPVHMVYVCIIWAMGHYGHHLSDSLAAGAPSVKEFAAGAAGRSAALYTAARSLHCAALRETSER